MKLAISGRTRTRLRHSAFWLLGAKAVMLGLALASTFFVDIPGIPPVTSGSLVLVSSFIASSAFLLARGYWVGALSTACYAGATISGAFAAASATGWTTWWVVVAISGIALLVVSLPLLLTPNPDTAESLQMKAYPEVKNHVV